MKVRIIKDKRIPISIDDTSVNDTVFDSEKFDTIPKELVLKVFEKKYKIHKNKLLEIVLSRMALSTAMSNIDEAIREHINNSLIVNTDKTVEAIDNGFTMALVGYAYSDAFSFIEDEEIRNDILTTMLIGQKGLKSKSPVGFQESPAVGASPSVTPNKKSIERDLKNIEAKVDKLSREDNSIYGKPTNVGMLGRNNAQRQNSSR